MTSKRANWLFLTIILVHFGVVAFLIFGGGLLPDSLVLNFLLSQGILVVPTLIFLLIFERRERQPVPPVPGAPQIPMSGMAQVPMSGAPHMPMPGMPQAPMPGTPQMPMPGMAHMPMSGMAQVPMPDMANAPRAPRPLEAAAFHRVKISTLLMIALCTFLIMPLVTVLNTLTMFFTDNAVAALEGDIVSTPFPAMLFMIGIFGPFCEEFVFRGVIYRSYRRSGEWENNMRYKTLRNNGVSAVILSSLLFGLMHMNFNQAVYAFAIGVFLVMLVEAAGSLWASVFCHMFFNSCQVVLMYVSESLLDSVYGQAVNETAGQLTTQDLLAALSIYLVIAAVTTPIAGCVIAWIAKNEGRQEVFRALFRRGGRTVGRGMPEPNVPPQPAQWNGQTPLQSAQWNQQMPPPAQWNGQTPPQLVQWSVSEPRADYLLSVPLIIAVVLCLGYMSLELFLL
ncbi:MAG: CPBP family intramembrane metalloprotease [Lachnospiraceae bacterium]|nr:CPBP family intramembrane metalloprotease [Lachnospiraceae bacterium]